MDPIAKHITSTGNRLVRAAEDRAKVGRRRKAWGPLYTMVFWPVLEEFGLTIPEYLVADAIDKLSGNHSPVAGWCNASKESLAALTRCSRSSAFRALKELREKGIVEENPERSDLLRTTKTWARTVELCRRRLKH